MNRRLFTVGPVEVRAEVLQAMTRPMMIHRGKEYKRLHEGIVDKLHRALDTDMEIMMVPASATGLMEACSRNAVESRMMCISNGAFGDRWQEISKANGKEVKEIDVPWGKAIGAEHLEGQVTEDIEAVAFVSNESSTGVLNPVGDILAAVREQGYPLIMMDGVTSVGGVDLRLRDLDLDALVFGTQKAFALPPGLAFICVSDRLLKKAERVEARGFYFDLLRIKRKNDEGYSLTTPPVSLMYALDLQLDRMLEEGMSRRYERHARMADMVRSWGERHHGLFAEGGHRSNTISVLNKGDMDFADLTSRLLAKGYEISNGYGSIKDTTFRIGHMGDLTAGDIEGLLKAMDEVLEETQ